MTTNNNSLPSHLFNQRDMKLLFLICLSPRLSWVQQWHWTVSMPHCMQILWWLECHSIATHFWTGICVWNWWGGQLSYTLCIERWSNDAFKHYQTKWYRLTHQRYLNLPETSQKLQYIYLCSMQFLVECYPQCLAMPTDTKGRLPLHLACIYGKSKIISYFIEKIQKLHKYAIASQNYLFIMVLQIVYYSTNDSATFSCMTIIFLWILSPKTDESNTNDDGNDKNMNKPDINKFEDDWHNDKGKDEYMLCFQCDVPAWCYKFCLVKNKLR